MKSLKFWLGRKELYHQKKAGKEKYEYLIETWKEFENFTLKYQEYNHQIFYLFKYSIHEEICENTLIEYQNNQNEQSVLLILAENLVIIDKQDDALDLLLYAERKNENYFDYKRASLLSNLYAQKREASKSIFYITHCFINDWYLKKEKNYKLFENTDFFKYNSIHVHSGVSMKKKLVCGCRFILCSKKYLTRLLTTLIFTVALKKTSKTFSKKPFATKNKCMKIIMSYPINWILFLVVSLPFIFIFPFQKRLKKTTFKSKDY